MPDTSGCCVCSALFRRISLRGAMAPEWYPWSISQGPGKVAKCPSWSPGALSRRHTRAACYLRPGPARPWYELDKSRLCRGPGSSADCIAVAATAEPVIDSAILPSESKGPPQPQDVTKKEVGARDEARGG